MKLRSLLFLLLLLASVLLGVAGLVKLAGAAAVLTAVNALVSARQLDALPTGDEVGEINHRQFGEVLLFCGLLFLGVCGTVYSYALLGLRDVLPVVLVAAPCAVGGLALVRANRNELG